MDMVRQEVARDPGVALDVLFDRAKEIDPAVAELTTRQFHARYPLQVKRDRAREEGPARTAAKRTRSKRSGGAPVRTPPRKAAADRGFDRDAVRNLFLEFASDFAEAESRQEIVRVLSGIDGYVDRVQKLFGGR